MTYALIAMYLAGLAYAVVWLMRFWSTRVRVPDLPHKEIGR